MRAKKAPFDVASADDTLDRNLIGGNSGDLLWTQAAYKLLSTPDVQIEIDGYRAHGDEADRINEEYDHVVIPLSNAFRIRFERQLIRLTRMIERLRIPVTILGVGAQSNVEYGFEPMRPLNQSVKAFVAAVLDHSPSIGVRGEYSAAYLETLGFRDVHVIGCPSMFMFGPTMRVERRVATLTPDARLALMVTPDIRWLGPLVSRHLAHYPNLTYIAQDLSDLAMLLWGEAPRGAEALPELPFYPGHPLIRQNRTRFYIDPWTWLDDLRGYDFAFGSRMHGTIAALQAGTPGYVLAHDSRTLELARYFEIPHRVVRDSASEIEAAQLYEEADYGPLMAGHAARFARLEDYLGQHGLGHIFAHPEAAEAFAARVRGTSYPPAVDASRLSTGKIEVPAGRRLHYWIRRFKRQHWVGRLRALALRAIPGRL